MSRKRALWARAEAWAERNQHLIVCRYSAAEGFDEGYRAAMRDARKALAEARDPYDPLQWRMINAIRLWLRPLR